MRLKAVAEGAPVGLPRLSADGELVREVQQRLSVAGLLDPPADGKFGSVSRWALAAFAALRGEDPEAGLTRTLAAALLAPGLAKTLPLVPGSGLAARLVRAMQEAGHWMSRHPACLTILYVEGMDPAGRPNGNAPNQFNDARLLLRIDEDGRPAIRAAWKATTEPGRRYTEHPVDPAGAARIAFGQYKSWVVGTHKPAAPSAHEALVQADEITIHRDLNRDFRREGDKTVQGVFGVNQHWGFDLPRKDIGEASAGCLVGRSKEGHREFMRLVKSDARYAASHGYRFMAAVLPAAAVPAG